MSVPDEEADRLAGIAIELVARVRDLDPRRNAAWLVASTRGPADWMGLCFVLAAAVPTDRSWWQLTGWTRDAQVQRSKPGGPDTWENIERRRDELDAALRPAAHEQREAAA